MERPTSERAVLVVEDEFLIAMDLEAVLERNGYRVVGPAGTVEEALRLLKSHTPDAAVLDVNLRGEMVTPVAVALRHAEIPFLYASAYGAVEFERRGLGDLPAPNIGKPVSETRLLAALASIGCGD